MSASKWKPYPKYKKTGFGWIDSIPNHWEVSRIKRIHRQTTNSFIDGDWVESPYILDDEKIRYITSGNIGEGKFKFQGSGYISEESFEELNCVEVFPGDLVISRLSLPVGRSCIIPDLGKRIITAVDNVIIRLNSKCDKHFFNYLFNSFESYENTSQLARGTTLQRISRTMLGDIETLIPLLNEQGKIVEFLDAQCDLINPILLQLEKERNSLKEKRSALITQAVTKGLNSQVEIKDSGIEWIGGIPTHWEIIPLKRDFSVQLGKMLQNEQKLASDTQEYYLKSANVQWNGVSLKPEVKMWFSEAEKSKYLLKKDDLLISEGGDVGRSCLYNDEYKECYIQNAINRVRATSTVPTAYLYFFMKAMHDSGFIDIICNKSTIPHFTAEKVAEVRFTRPPEDEMNSIVEHLTKECNAIDETSSRLLNKIEKLKEYRTALISAAVTGKIDVRSL